MRVELVPLAEVASFVRGVTFKPDDVVSLESERAVACMRTKNVQHELDVSDVWGISEDLVRRDDQYLIAGDVLVSTANSWNLVGKCCAVPTLQWRSTFGGFVSVLRPERTKVDPRYLFRWFASDRMQKTVRSFGQQTTNISNLNIDRCLKLPIPLPPLAEQRRIAQILDKSDSLRAKRRTALLQLDAMTQSIFRDMFGDLRQRGWPIVRFAEVVADAKLGLVRGSKDVGPHHPYPYVRMNSLSREGALDLSNLQFTHASDDEKQAYRLEPGDFLFNTRNSRELVGKTALYRAAPLHLFNNNLMRIRFNEVADPVFMAAVFRTEFVKRELECRKSGTTSVFAIYYKDLKSVPIPLPPMKLQQQFARRIQALEMTRIKQRESQAALDALFVSLQHRAFRGEL